MSWEYKVTTGVLSHNGEFVASCYSGAGESKDKPECEQQRNKGPIPLLPGGTITKAQRQLFLNL